MTCAAASFAYGTAANVQGRDDLLQKINSTTGDMQRYIDLLRGSNQATHLATRTEMSRSSNPAVVDLAIETGLGSDDRAMLATAARATFHQVRSFVAKIAPQGSPMRRLERS